MILAFATADPSVQVFSDRGLWYLLGSPRSPPSPSSCTCAGPRRRWSRAARCARRRPGARSWSASSSGSALIAALIDIPIFARTTTYRTSQLMAALVLVRFLVALPVGAVVGGYLIRTRSAGLVTAVGMAMSAIGFFLMSRWDIDSLDDPSSNIALVICGFGFGLALAPVNAAVLAHTDAGRARALVRDGRRRPDGRHARRHLGADHDRAAPLLRRAGRPPDGRPRSAASRRCARPTATSRSAAGVAQEQTVFLGAVFCALAAGVLALFVFRGAATRAIDAHEARPVAGLTTGAATDYRPARG